MSHPGCYFATLDNKGKLRKTKRTDMVMGDDTNQDLISELPNEILTSILSKLCVDEAVRCSVLSERWEDLWKEVSHIELDTKNMIRPMTQLLHSREPQTLPDLIINPSLYKEVERCNTLLFMLIDRHSGNLSSCRISHFRRGVLFNELEYFIDYLVENKKGLKDLSLECELRPRESTEKLISDDKISKPYFSCGVFKNLGSLQLTNYILCNSCAFKDCNNLKHLVLKRIFLVDAILNGILENCVALENFSLIESTGFKRLIIMKSTLKVLQLQNLCVKRIEISGQNLDVLLLDSIICLVKNITIYAPCLRIAHFYCYSLFARALSIKWGKSLLKTHEVLGHYSNNSEPPSCNIFQNLSTLSMDLDLNRISDINHLSSILRLCSNLQSIDIFLPVFRPKSSCSSSSSNNGALSSPTSMFWEMREVCNCILKKLKFVNMRGFQGNEPEVEFAKYLITRATMLQRIEIVCNDSMEAARILLSLPKASINLSINLKLNANNIIDEIAEHQSRLLKR